MTVRHVSLQNVPGKVGYRFDYKSQSIDRSSGYLRCIGDGLLKENKDFLALKTSKEKYIRGRFLKPEVIVIQ